MAAKENPARRGKPLFCPQCGRVTGDVGWEGILRGVKVQGSLILRLGMALLVMGVLPAKHSSCSNLLRDSCYRETMTFCCIAVGDFLHCYSLLQIQPRCYSITPDGWLQLHCILTLAFCICFFVTGDQPNV